MSSAPPPNPAVPPSRPAQRSGPAAVLASLLKGPISALHVLLLSLIAVAVALLLCILLAFNVLPGYPDSAEKNVTVYSQTGPSSPALSFYLNPPLNALQASGESQLLAVQFTNRGSTSLNVTGLDASPESCFYVESSDRSPRVPTPDRPVPLAAGRSAFFLYHLYARHTQACIGQFPLILRYSWKDTTAAASESEQQQSISTGPIRVSTRGRILAERFFSLLARIIPLILLPLVLAAGGYIFQLLQEQKARQQKRQDDKHDAEQKLQEQKLEVWKAIIPSMVQAIRDHYVPLMRVLTLIQADAQLPVAQADLNDVLASALLFRTKITHMVDQNGGFYFRNHAGEKLCADLTNVLLDRFYTLCGDKQTFLRTAEKLQPGNSLTQARQSLRIDSPLPGPFAQLCARFKTDLAQGDALDQLCNHVTFLCKILDHEINDPFYPFWYDTPPALIKKDELTALIPKLGWNAADEETLRTDIGQYMESLERTGPHPVA